MACSKLEAMGHLLHKTGLWQWSTGISVPTEYVKQKFVQSTVLIINEIVLKNVWTWSTLLIYLATVQAALGPVALDSLYNSDLDPNSDLYKLRKELGLKILTIAVLVILITAPIGSIAITLSGPKLLNKKSSNTEGETQENLNLEEGNS